MRYDVHALLRWKIWCNPGSWWYESAIYCRWDGCRMQKPKATNGKFRKMNLNFNLINDDQFNRRLRWFWVILLLIRMPACNPATNKIKERTVPPPHRTAQISANSTAIFCTWELVKGFCLTNLADVHQPCVVQPIVWTRVQESARQIQQEKGPMKTTWQTLMANNWTAFENLDSMGFDVRGYCD